MKKVIYICLPVIVLAVLLLGSGTTFKQILSSISTLDFKMPDFLELQSVLNTIKSLLTFEEVEWYNIPLHTLQIILQIGNLIGNAVKFIVLFFYDFVWNVIQVLGLFGRLILN